MAHPATIHPDLARSRLMDGAVCIASAQTIPINDADGRIMAADMVATSNLPASPNAAVDGYAVHADFLARHPDHKFTIVGRAAAGHPFTGTIAPGEALRIFTGAIIPQQTRQQSPDSSADSSLGQSPEPSLDGVPTQSAPDAVAMHEDCTADDTGVRINKMLKPGSNYRPAGENISVGEIIIPAGKRLGPADLGIASAAGFGTLTVRRRLTVGLLSMGDEIIDAGAPLQNGQTHDSNRPMLASLLRADGHIVRDYGIIPDDANALGAAYAKALDECDIVLSSGGASDGDEDHTQQALQQNGVDLIFWRLAMKPGRPMAVGSYGDKRIFCLPGNPVAAFVCYRLFCAPTMAIMGGGIPTVPMRLPVQAGFSHKKNAGRAEYLRVHLEPNHNGTIMMQLHGRRGAGVLSSVTGAQGLVEIPVENDGVSEGDYLSFIPFREAGL